MNSRRIFCAALLLVAVFQGCKNQGQEANQSAADSSGQAVSSATRNADQANNNSVEGLPAGLRQLELGGSFVFKAQDLSNQLRSGQGKLAEEALQRLLNQPVAQSNGPGGPSEYLALGQFKSADGEQMLLYASHVTMMSAWDLNVARIGGSGPSQPVTVGAASYANDQGAVADRVFLDLDESGKKITVSFNNDSPGFVVVLQNQQWVRQN